MLVWNFMEIWVKIINKMLTIVRVEEEKAT